jgi:GNAT superfamily N-acetyltransferase
LQSFAVKNQPYIHTHYFCRMISYVRLTPDDAALLSEMGGVSLIESHGHSAAPETMQAYVDRSFSVAACRTELEESRNIFTAVYYNGELAGYTKIICNVSHPAIQLEPVTKMERLYLLKAFYGLQLGLGLLQEALAFSKTAGDRGMWLNVWKENHRALRFYEKHGFVTVGESEFVLTATHANPNWVMLLTY